MISTLEEIMDVVDDGSTLYLALDEEHIVPVYVDTYKVEYNHYPHSAVEVELIGIDFIGEPVYILGSSNHSGMIPQKSYRKYHVTLPCKNLYRFHPGNIKLDPNKILKGIL